MRDWILILGVAGALLGLGAEPVASQCPEDLRLQAASALEETGRRVSEADSLVRESDHEGARDEFDQAIRLQSEANAAFAAEDCGRALDLSRRARFRAIHAIELVRGLPDLDRVVAQVERTHEVLHQARDRTAECAEARAHRLLRAASQMQRRADDALATERPLAALQLTVGARDRAFQALRACGMREDLELSADRAIRRTDEAISRAGERIEGPGEEQAIAMLGRARELLDRARGDRNEGRFEQAIRQAISARAQAYRAARLVGGPPRLFGPPPGGPPHGPPPGRRGTRPR